MEDFAYVVPPSVADEGVLKLRATGPNGLVGYKGERFVYTLTLKDLPVKGEAFYVFQLDPALWSISAKGEYTVKLCYEISKKQKVDPRSIWEGVVETPECTFTVK